MNKRTAQIILASLGISVLSPAIEVQAKETTSVEQETKDSNEELKEQAKKWGLKVLDFFVDANELADETITAPVIDTYQEKKTYKHEELWLITDMPNTDPKEARHFYFVKKKKTKIPVTWFYDSQGNRVENNDSTAVRKYEQIRYQAIGDSETTFMIRNDYNLLNNTWTTNYMDFNAEYLWEEETPLEFGRFTNISEIIPPELQKEKYTIKELKEILEIINNCEYELSSDSSKRVLEQK